MPWPQLGHSCSTVARVDFRFIVCSVLPDAQAGAALAFVRVSRGSAALDSPNEQEAPQFEHCSGSLAGISRKPPQWPQNKFPPMESTTRRFSAIPARVRRLWGLCVRFCVCLLRALRRSRSICDHARQRQVLSSNRCVVSGRARGCGMADAGVMRRRAAVVSAGAGAMERPRWHLCHGCRTACCGCRSVCRVAVVRTRLQRCAPAKIGYERCRRSLRRNLIDFSLQTRACRLQRASGM